MWLSRYYHIAECRRFFRIGLSHDNLANYYKVNFILMQHYNYSLSDIEHMLRFEREVYLMLLEQHIKEQNEALQQKGNM